MRGLWLKLGLFLVLWYEVAAELRLGSDASFLVAVGIIAALWFGFRLAGQLLALLGPTGQRLIVGAVVWSLLFWWFAPASLRSLPLIYVALGGLGLAVAAARIRHAVTPYLYRYAGRA